MIKSTKIYRVQSIQEDAIEDPANNNKEKLTGLLMIGLRDDAMDERYGGPQTTVIIEPTDDIHVGDRFEIQLQPTTIIP